MQRNTKLWMTLTGVIGGLLVSAAAYAEPTALCVPWVTTDNERTHFAYDGATVQLMGIARNLTPPSADWEYRWDFGDGDGTNWAPITDPYNLGVQHVYNGLVGQLFIATLHVRDSTGEDTDVFRIGIYHSADPRNPYDLQIRVNMAIDKGLWYLHTNMNRNTFGPGAPGYEQPYGGWNSVNSSGANAWAASTGVGLAAFQLRGHRVTQDPEDNPYADTVYRAMTYLLANAATVNIPVQPAGDPDTNGNGTGLRINPNNYSVYAFGMSAMGICQAFSPGWLSPVGGNEFVYQQPLASIAQDLCEYFYFGMTDDGNARGGWRYTANSGQADNSTNQWPYMAILPAEENLNLVVPQWVRDEQAFWIAYSQNTALTNDNGCFGYQSAAQHPNCSKTGAGLINLTWLGVPSDDPRQQKARGFLYRHWADNANGWDYTRNLGCAYSMYAVQKSMRQPEPDIVHIHNYDYNNDIELAENFDWYFYPPGQTQEGMAHYIVRTQQSDGQWDDAGGAPTFQDAHCTGFYLLCLYPEVALVPPVALTCECEFAGIAYHPGQDIELHGDCSYHPDPNRTIVDYEWDFDYDGITFDIDAIGPNTVIVDGYPAPGTYTVALRVRDDHPINPVESTFTCDVEVTNDPLCPIADPGENNGNGSYDGFVGSPVLFDGSNSWDPDDLPGQPGSDIEFYLWDFDNDGTFGDGIAPTDPTTPTESFQWDAPGVYAVGLKVIDYAGCEATAFTTCTVGNHPPIADIGGPYCGLPNETIQLDASGSTETDPGDMIVSYLWDLDNDGVYDDASGAIIDFTIGDVPIGYNYPICVRVEDTFGAYDHDCASVVVDDCGGDPAICDAGGPYTADCAGATTTIALDGTNSQDPDGGALSFLWDSDCPGAVFDDPTSPNPILTVNTDGMCPGDIACSVTLTVTDADGPVSCAADITIVDETAPTFDDDPEDISVYADAGVCEATLTIDTPTATDVCDPNPLVEGLRDDGLALADPYPVGTTTITWTVSDACGNETSIDQTVTVAGESQLLVTVQLQGVTEPTLNRCINFEVFNTGAGTSITFQQVLTFTDGVATDIEVLVPCGVYDCMTATDPLHTLVRANSDAFQVIGTQYVADFTDQSGGGGLDHALLGGNINGDVYVDMLDFGLWVGQLNTVYGDPPSGDTDCDTPAPHCDISGDGVVLMNDWTYITANFGLSDEACDGGLVAINAMGMQQGPVTSITIAELNRRGLSDLAVADLNGDGVLNPDDIAAFMRGARPKKPNSIGSTR